MSRSQNLRHNVINQVINDMARGFIPSPLPSQSALAEMYNISRTTVRHMLSHLGECGVLTQVGSHYVIVRRSITTTRSFVNRKYRTASIVPAPRWPNKTVSLNKRFSP